MSDDVLPQPPPPRLAAFLAALARHWSGRSPVTAHLVPPGRAGQEGFPCVEDAALVCAERQAFRCEWPGGGVTVHEDEVLLLPTDRPYRLVFDERQRRHLGLTIAARQDDVVLFRRNAPREEWPRSVWRLAAGSGAAVDAALRLALRLRELGDGHAAWAGPALRAAVATVLAAGAAACAAPLRPSRGGPSLAVRCRTVLRERLHDPRLRVEDVAAALGQRADGLGREYRRETGQTLRQTLRLLRVQAARDLLHQGGLDVAEVARRCGFASASDFSRAFRAIAGNPPSAYRRYGHLECETR